MWTKAIGIALCLIVTAEAFYQSSDVIELSEAEFNKQVCLYHHYQLFSNCYVIQLEGFERR